MDHLLLIQYRGEDGKTRAARVIADGSAVESIGGGTLYELAREAAESGRPLAEIVGARASGNRLDYAALAEQGRLLSPIAHPDPAHCLITGTGLTHLASAAGRDKMHTAAMEGKETDSMRMYAIGVEGGRPVPGRIGAPPEWFFKGDGGALVPPGGDLPLPAYAEDGGEESEIAGLYLIRSDGTPMRIGYALGNEYSDHRLESRNYLYLAHSKLRACSVGPEILVGALPAEISGRASILRGGQTLWSEDFKTGEANMCHTLTNLEHHHFKYRAFRRPGDVHVHFFGAASVSYAHGVTAKDGDMFEIAAPPFVQPLRNRLRATPDEGLVAATPL